MSSSTEPGSVVAAERSASLADYQILGRLGVGVASETFLAKTFGAEGFEKPVVLKRLQPALVSVPGFVDGFIEAMRDAARLSHANIVQLLDVGEDTLLGERVVFVVSEHVAGMDLEGILERAVHAGVSMPVPVACFVGSELTKALDHAHRHRSGRVILHGGVTPRQVILSWEGEVKLEGFSVTPHVVRAVPALAGHYPRRDAGAEASQADDLLGVGLLLARALAPTTPRDARPEELLARARDASGASSELVALIEVLIHGDDKVTARGVHEELLALFYRLPERPHARSLAELVVRLGRPGQGRTPTLGSDADVRAEADAALVETPASDPAESGSSGTATASQGTRREVSMISLVGAASDEVEALAREAGALVVGRGADEVRILVGLAGTSGRDVEQAVALAQRVVASSLGAGVAVHAGRVLVGPTGEVARDVVLEQTWAMLARVAQSSQGKILATREAARILRLSHVLEAETSPFGDTVCSVAGPRTTPPSPFFGRGEALAVFGEVLAAVDGGRPGVVVVRGGPGVGKTRLVAELEERLAREERRPHFHAVTCPPKAAPLGAARIVARALLGGHASEDLREGAAQTRLRELGVVIEDAEAIGHLLFGVGSDEALVALPGAFVALLTAASRAQALVLVLDEADALDVESERLLDAALDPDTRARLLVVVIARGARRFFDARAAEAIALGPLSEDAIAAWLAHRFAATIVPQQAVDLVIERSQGNPMFVEQLFRSLSEQAVASVDRGVLTLLAERADIPRSLRALLEARIDRLTPAARATLSAFAVLGSDASLAELAHATHLDERETKRAIFELDGAVVVDAGLLAFEKNALRLEVPAVLAEVARDMLVPETRAQLHARAATFHLDAARRDPLGVAGEDLLRAARFFVAAGDAGAALEAYRLGARDGTTADVVAEATANELALDASVPVVTIAERLAHVLASTPSDASLLPFADVADVLFARVVEPPHTADSARAALSLSRILVRARAATQAAVLLEHPVAALADEASLAVARLEWCESVGDVVHGLEDARRLAAAPIVSARASLLACRILSAAKATDEARRHLADVRAHVELEGKGDALSVHVELTDARLSLDAGEALDAIGPARRAAAAARGRRVDVAAAALLLGEALLGVDKRDRAYAAFVEAFEAADGLAVEPLSTMARAYLAFVEGLPNPSDALAVAEREVAPLRARLAAFGHFAEAAIVGALLATLYRAGGAVDDARARATEAKADFARLGNLVRVAEAERLLASL